MTEKLKSILDYFRHSGWNVNARSLQSGRTIYHCTSPGPDAFMFNIGESENPTNGETDINIVLPRRATYGGEVAALLGIITALGVEIQHARAPINLPDDKVR